MSDSGGVRRVVVIGAGMAGLSAAATLRSAGVEVVVLEREHQVGGRIRTVAIDGQPIDVGAQFVATFCTETLAMARSVPLARPLRKHARDVSVAHDGAAFPVGSVKHLLRSALLPFAARCRLPLLAAPVFGAWRKLDPRDLSKAQDLDTEHADQFVRRWAGDAVAERFVEPIVRGLLYWDLSSTSRAVLLVMLRVALQGRVIYTIDRGLGLLPEALAADLDVRTGISVTALRRIGDGTWIVECGDADPIEADAVACCTTASVAASLCPDAATAALLGSVTYSRTISIVYRLAEAASFPQATQLFAGEPSALLASVNPFTGESVNSSRYVRIFLSNDGATRVADLDDTELSHIALAAAVEAGGDAAWAVGATPVHVCRWNEALPRFDVGALRSRAVCDPASVDVGTLVFAGDYMGGPFIEGAVSSGASAARRLLAKLHALGDC